MGFRDSVDDAARGDAAESDAMAQDALIHAQSNIGAAWIAYAWGREAAFGKAMDYAESAIGQIVDPEDSHRYAVAASKLRLLGEILWD